MPSEWAKEMRARFHSGLTPEQAIDALRAFGQDESQSPRDRMHVASAMLELKTGRSVQSALARFRRSIGADPQKKPQADW